MENKQLCEIEVDDKGNRVVGGFPGVYQSAIVWGGNNNILFCEKGVDLRNSKLTFNGNNSLIFLQSNAPVPASLDLSIFSDSVIYIGRRCRAKQTVRAVIGEKKHLYVGDDCLFSSGITIRNADGHMVYSADNYDRVNSAKSIFLGDHVWIGQDCLIMKGTSIDSGAVIGGASTIAGKTIKHNSAWAGNPGRFIESDVFWDISFPDDYDIEKLSAAENYEDFLKYEKKNADDKDRWIYRFEQDGMISWEDIDNHLSTGSAMDKCRYLFELNKNPKKNRFVHQ